MVVSPAEDATMQKIVVAVLAYSYLRFSHPDQAKGDSLRRQTELRNAWLARNKVKLDTSLTLADKGVSGYTGEHRDNPDRHALAAFLALVKQGRVAKGSFLIVENLDRLSREDIIPALSLCLDLIQAGVRIVQLIPTEMAFDLNANPMQVMMMIMELSRGHSESAVKSERVGSAWKEKKRDARDNRTPATARGPAWLRLVDGAWQLPDPARAALRRVLELVQAGYGLTGLARRLNSERVPCLSAHKRSAKRWTRSYLGKLLNDRRLFGEYQPYKGRGKKRQPDGPPVPGYYPAVWEEEEFYAARAAVADRRGKAGRPAAGRVNVFAGLLYDARTGSTLNVANKGARSSGRVLVPYQAQECPDAGPVTSFPFDSFEAALLGLLREVKPAEVLPPQEAGRDETVALSGRITDLEGEIEKVKGRLRQRYTDALAEVLEQHEDEMKALAGRLAKAREKAAAPVSEAWGQFRTLVQAVEGAPDPEEARLRLRAALRRIVEAIHCLFVGRGRDRLCAVQVWFKDDGHRDYLILHRRATGGSVGTRPARWWARSLAEVAPGDLDLRRREDARTLAEALAAVDLAACGEAG
jgi:DNA invertase Pin-like site-specific DNA recombinase